MLIAGTSTKSVVASRVSSAPRIDGVLTDQEWQWAIPVSGFQQFDPEEGAAPTEQTSVMVVYDDNALYFGVICYDSEPDAIVRQLTRRDRTVQADRFSVIIDSYHDHASAFLFGGSAAGVQSDGVLSQDGRVYDVQWDAVWDFSSAMNDRGWTAEFKIPFSALRFSDQDSEYVWGINFRRYVARKKETDEWVMVPRKETPPGTVSSVSRMGHLSGIKDIHPPLHLEVLPYQVSKANYLAQPAPFSLRKEFKGTAGLDLKYGVTNNFTFDMAINPDFGQVEVDQAVLNLTVFETQYPEKRPFFTEGASLFSFGNVFDNRQLQLFYSRRIGKKPSLSGPPNAGYAFVQNPQTTTILGAAKLTGRTEDGLAVGILTATTDREEATEEDVNGIRNSPFIVEPRASYNVLRLKKDILENSSLGMMATGSFKEQNAPSLSGGVDWNFRFKDGEYALDGYLAGSQLTTAPDQRLTGGAGRIGLGKLNDEHWLAFSLYDFSSKNFSIDDLGFYSQPREHGGYTQLTYKQDRAGAPVRRYALTVQTDYRWNWDGINTMSQVEFEPSWEFRNFWLLTFDYVHLLPAYDDLNRGIIGLYHRPAGNRITATLQTDNRKPIGVLFFSAFENTTKRSSFFQNTFNVTLRPSSWIELAPAFTWISVRNEEAWVYPIYITDPAVSSDQFNLFGDRDIDQYDFSLRGTFTFTRSLSFQFFMQILLAKGHYANFRNLLDQDTFQPYNYSNYSGYYDPDFNEKTLNANFVLRWEYLPGSELFVVYNDERNTLLAPALRNRAFVVKINRLFRL
jgi:hypothetical protein